MAKRLFSYSDDNLRQAEEVSQLLTKNNIEHYETPANRWGFSKAAIWIQDNSDFERAKSLFEAHILDYAQRAREAYQEETGYNPDAPLSQRIRFNLNFIYRRIGLLPLVLFGLGLVILYFYLFLNLFI